tara:strand:- start:142 stop:534 length:393 start_codon:yes stop_codon:yes gene_type:complete
MINSIITKEKFPKNEPKGLLKNIALKFFPRNFVYRRKAGFVLPYSNWLREKNELGGFLDIISDKTFKERSYFNYTKISKLIDKHLNYQGDYSKLLMRLIYFEIWHRSFIDSNSSLHINNDLFIPKNESTQ